MSKIEAVFVGHTAFNTDVSLKTSTTRTTIGGGGLSPAFAASLVLEPEKIGLISRVGTDNFGVNLVNFLKKRGINSDGLEIVPEGKTLWVSLIEFSDGNRRIAVDPGVSTEVRLFIPDNYKNAQYVHLGSGPSDQQLQWLTFLRDNCSGSTKIAADPLEIFIPKYPEETKKVLNSVDLVFINETELQLLRQFGELSKDIPTILKLGEKGIVYINGDEVITVPAPKVKAVHTTGAGETIAGVFIGRTIQGTPLREALEEAVAVASLSVTDYGMEHLPNTYAAYKKNITTAIK